MDRERPTLDTLLGAQPRGFREARDELWATIGITRVIECVHPDKDIARRRSFSESRGQCQEHQIARRHIGNGDRVADTVFGNIDLVGQRRTAELAQIEGQLDMPLEVVFESISDEISLPLFRPATGS